MNMISFDGEQMKQIVYAFTKYACAVKFDIYRYDDQFQARVKEIAGLNCKRQLSKKLEDFIKLDYDMDRGEVVGTINLPYIRDEEMATLSRQIESQFIQLMDKKREVDRLAYKIRQFNKLPWYKRLWKTID